MKTKVLNISLVVVVGPVKTVDNLKIPKNNNLIIKIPVDNLSSYQHQLATSQVIHSYPQEKVNIFCFSLN